MNKFKENVKLVLAVTLCAMVLTGSVMAFGKNEIKEIKAINKEIQVIEIDLYEATQKKAVREAEIKKLQAELSLVDNHILERQAEAESLTEQKEDIMSGGSVQTSFTQPQNK